MALVWDSQSRPSTLHNYQRLTSTSNTRIQRLSLRTPRQAGLAHSVNSSHCFTKARFLRLTSPRCVQQEHVLRPLVVEHLAHSHWLTFLTSPLAFSRTPLVGS